METKFVYESQDIPGTDDKIWFDGNSKVAVGKPFADPTPNCFSLVSIDDCPYSTPICRSSCYTAGIKEFAPDTFAKYHLNSTTIRKYLGVDEQPILKAFTTHIQKNNIDFFRWHVSGDIFSETYAKFIAQVCKASPDTTFWIYTRSFPWVHHITGIDNLTVNLSGDVDNIAECESTTNNNPGTRVCYMSTDGSVPEWLSNGSVIFPDYNLRGRDLDTPTDAPWWNTLTQEQKRMVCPPDFFGQSENIRCGPCTKCIDQPKELVQISKL